MRDRWALEATHGHFCVVGKTPGESEPSEWILCPCYGERALMLVPFLFWFQLVFLQLPDFFLHVSLPTIKLRPLDELKPEAGPWVHTCSRGNQNSQAPSPRSLVCFWVRVCVCVCGGGASPQLSVFNTEER